MYKAAAVSLTMVDETLNKTSQRAFEIDFLNVGGYSIRVGIVPGNRHKTPILLFNGIATSFEFAQPFAQALDDVTLITFDIPGVGGSPTPLMPPRFPQLSFLTEQLLDELNLGQVNVIGYSWGGALAQQFTYDHPQRVKQLILAATTMGMVAIPGLPMELFKLLKPGILLGSLKKMSIQQAAGCQWVIPQQGSRGFWYQLITGWGWTSAYWLRKIKTKTLLLAGDHDLMVPAINLKVMQQLMPNAQFRSISGDHFFMVTQPRACARMIGEFCEYF
ncbi:alpha/beta fold hydrolase [Zooshikella marina]|uniref:alpha/beta fold hydrolase n=1 Tax=Zooshikella ganghwensis TaxID=202772 RepID=UPI001BAF8ABC|nr:alpha/beta fold hydrolase [Zooshikella ganghwensis]MBU2704468.1 alpha/beta fold hydrolase [Zooshikella ganghwensis]